MKLIFSIIIFLISSSFSHAWEEVDCNSISKEAYIEHSYYIPQDCWRWLGSPVSYALQFYDGRHFIDYMTQTITATNTIWGSDYAYQNLKKDSIEETFQNRNLGVVISISSKPESILSSDNKIRYYYKTVETSDGKAVYGGNTMDKTFYTFLFFTEDKSENLNEDFLSELLTSLTIKGKHKGKSTSVSLSSGNSNNNTTNNNSKTNKSNNSSSSSQSFIEMCKNSTLSDLDKDVAMLCLEKMDN